MVHEVYDPDANGGSGAPAYIALDCSTTGDDGNGNYVDWTTATVREEGGAHGVTLTVDGLHVADEATYAITVQASFDAGGDETYRGVGLTDALSPTFGPFNATTAAQAGRIASISAVYRFPAGDDINIYVEHDSSTPRAVSYRAWISRL